MKLNKSEFKWFVILICFTYYVYNLLSSGKIYLYLNPKMIKYVRFSFIIFLILTIFQLRRLFIPTQINKRKVYFCVFLVPLFLGIYINPQGLNDELISKKGEVVMKNSISKKISTSQTQSKSIQKDTPKDNILVVDGKNFTHIADDICYNNPSKYKGKDIVITGFVFRDGTNSKDKFLIARLMMVCCAADTEVTGLVCDWNKASTLKNNKWIKITGKIDVETENINGEKSSTPVIRVEGVDPAQKPQNQYIYPE
ncbi:putative two-component membrane permease complex subunit [Clostridium ragsdalei P11]|uniref:Putative two-component membrane permease complex subunit n=1 Tax=Clostridium ragsdalei P11 TaxID=1353534 RepID=A0A1A6AJC7_9CLOT|nr:TIGR03943 family protein [Clostridium ragsdalei]OBR90118.1 putative two-component membrane permease complex subunit [Clostridium ragsdalei P11]